MKVIRLRGLGFHIGHHRKLYGVLVKFPVNSRDSPWPRVVLKVSSDAPGTTLDQLWHMSIAVQALGLSSSEDDMNQTYRPQWTPRDFPLRLRCGGLRVSRRQVAELDLRIEVGSCQN